MIRGQTQVLRQTFLDRGLVCADKQVAHGKSVRGDKLAACEIQSDDRTDYTTINPANRNLGSNGVQVEQLPMADKSLKNSDAGENYSHQVDTHYLMKKVLDSFGISVRMVLLSWCNCIFMCLFSTCCNTCVSVIV